MKANSGSIDYGCDIETYRRHHAVNHSTLKHISKSPAHYQYALTHPTETTPAMEFGSLVDHMVFGTPFMCCVSEYDDFRSKEAKAWRDEKRSGGYAIFKQSDWLEACEVSGSVKSRKSVQDLLDKGDSQVAVYATLQDVECKGLLDWVSSRYAVIADLKTTCKDAAATVLSGDDGISSGDAWAREVINRGYDVQAAFYVDLFKEASGEDMAFRWIVVESEPPYECAVWEATPDFLERGRRIYRQRLAMWRECKSSGVWGGYPDKVQYLGLPTWAQKQEIAAPRTYDIDSGIGALGIL